MKALILNNKILKIQLKKKRFLLLRENYLSKPHNLESLDLTYLYNKIYIEDLQLNSLKKDLLLKLVQSKIQKFLRSEQ